MGRLLACLFPRDGSKAGVVASDAWFAWLPSTAIIYDYRLVMVRIDLLCHRRSHPLAPTGLGRASAPAPTVTVAPTDLGGPRRWHPLAPTELGRALPQEFGLESAECG